MRWFHRICDEVAATILIAVVLLLIDPATRGPAHPPTLLIDLGGERRQFSATELLGNPATKTIEIARMRLTAGPCAIRPFRFSISCAGCLLTRCTPSKPAQTMASPHNFPGV